MFRNISGPFRIFILLFLCTLPLTASFGNDEDSPSPEATISVSEVSLHLRFLASDELRGREAGTMGSDVAARYIAEVFRVNGLKPALDGDFMQVVPLRMEYPPQEQELVLMERKLEAGKDFLALSGSNVDVAGELVDCGLGLDVDAGADLGGKVALVRFGAPEDENGMRAIRQKRELLGEHGVAAILEVYSGPMWSRFADYLTDGRISVGASTVGRPEVPHILLRAGQENWAEMLAREESAQARLKLSARRVEELPSNNVIGILEGSDPLLKDQYVALTAHYDHIGTRPATDADSASRDRIYNGARDNGMGTASLLTAARTLSEKRPARSLLFIAFTAEEKGLLGSRHYVENPVIPLEETVFVLNNDGAGYTETSLVTLLGFNRTSATSVIERACEEFGLDVVGPPEGLERLFRQSDNIAFAEEGVPAVTFSPGFLAFDEELREYYHQVTDHADENFDFEYLRRFAQSYALSARYLADAPESPSWNPGDDFADKAEKLYGTR